MAASAWVDAYKLPFLSQAAIREVSARELCSPHVPSNQM